LNVHVAMHIPTKAGALAEIAVRMEPMRRGGDAAARLLEETGPLLLESLRKFCQAKPERRIQARLPFVRSVNVVPLMGDRRVGDVVVSETKDISMRGMGLYMPCRPPSMTLQIRLPGAAPAEELAVPACIVRAIPRDDGRYEVGVRFLIEEGKPA